MNYTSHFNKLNFTSSVIVPKTSSSMMLRRRSPRKSFKSPYRISVILLLAFVILILHNSRNDRHSIDNLVLLIPSRITR